MLIPGDMGRVSDVLVGTEPAMKETFGSTCHGAGRVKSRAAAKKQLRGRDVLEALQAHGITVRTDSLSGLAEEEKSRRIILEALRRQEKFHISTISGTLLPPYPKKLFKHPLVDDPFEYQNGAQWDWFGARLIYAMFQQGFYPRRLLRSR